MPFDGVPCFGDVVLVPFPFTNLSTTKQRPAVVVSSAAYAQARPDVVLMAITSQIRSPLAYADALLADWQAANLLKASLLKPLLAPWSNHSSSGNWGRSAAAIKLRFAKCWR